MMLMLTRTSISQNLIMQGLNKESLKHPAVRLLNITFFVQVALYQVCIVTGQNIRSPVTFGLALLTFIETYHVVYCAFKLRAFDSRLTTAARLAFQVSVTVFFVASTVYEVSYQADWKMSGTVMRLLDYSILVSIMASIVTEVVLVVKSLIDSLTAWIRTKKKTIHSIVV